MKSQLFSFPNPVNEVSARLVAGGVAVLCLIAIGFELPWLTLVIAYGFIARLLTGPTLSPLGQLVTRVITPALKLPEKYCPGPPKRFAQGIGVVFSVTAAVLAVGLGLSGAAWIVLGVLAAFAILESVFGFCMGCKVFSLLMKLGLIPDEICESCNNITLGRPSVAGQS